MIHLNHDHIRLQPNPNNRTMFVNIQFSKGNYGQNDYLPSCYQELADPLLVICGRGGIGRHARFRFWCSRVKVRVLSSAPQKPSEMTKSSLAAFSLPKYVTASGIRFLTVPTSLPVMKHYIILGPTQHFAMLP